MGHIEPAEYFENQIITKTGEHLDIAWHNNYLKDKSGKINGTVSSGENITKQKRAFETIIKLNEELEDKVKQRTQELHHSNSELEAFAYSVSHDLRAPLRSIDGYANILMDEYFTKLDKEALRILEVIRKSSHHMDQLIFDLLTMSKATRVEMKIENIDMRKMVESIFTEIISTQSKKEYNFSVEHLPSCNGDPSLIRQVWFNLLSNAIKYSSKNPNQTIHVRGLVEPGSVCYSITDNGVGFNQAYQSKLFEPFQRLHTSEEFEGTGIGLAIVERIIRRHKGKVWADSKEGHGATFYFSLPQKI
jgi:light-regulated signal transduction histidine kinase (bacteriophytochrome)